MSVKATLVNVVNVVRYSMVDIVNIKQHWMVVRHCTNMSNGQDYTTSNSHSTPWPTLAPTPWSMLYNIRWATQWSMTPAHFRGTTGRKGEKHIVLTVEVEYIVKQWKTLQWLLLQCKAREALKLLMGHLLEFLAWVNNLDFPKLIATRPYHIRFDHLNILFLFDIVFISYIIS